MANNCFNLSRLLSRFVQSLRSAQTAPIDGSQVKRMLCRRRIRGAERKEYLAFGQ